VGHETDFTIADFVADLRAPTPTAAAELVAEPTSAWLGLVTDLEARMGDAMGRYLDRQSQRIDLAASRLGRPSSLAHRQRIVLSAMEQRMQHAARMDLQMRRSDLARLQQDWRPRFQRTLQGLRERSQRAELRLGLLDPTLVLQRGYAWLTLESGQTLGHVAQAIPGQHVRATLADGVVDMTVTGQGQN
jgi:exodeoxyribonuclease VII large subunit